MFLHVIEVVRGGVDVSEEHFREFLAFSFLVLNGDDEFGDLRVDMLAVQCDSFAFLLDVQHLLD